MTLLTAPATTATGTDPASLATTVKHVAGMLWYEMLSAMDATTGADSTLGPGADDFQSLFNWNIAENDFGKYDDQLAAAATAQLSHHATAASAAPADLSGILGTPVPSLLGALGGFPAQTGVPAAAALPSVSATTDSTTAAPTTAAALLPKASAYAQELWPQITAAAQQLGVPPVAILAQSALETGWGQSAAGNNFFGIKAAPGQPATMRNTTEMEDGVLTPQSAAFRDYASPADSIADYVNLIQSGYQPALGQNSVAGYANTLQSAGYATDQNYAAKILAISQSPLMRQVLQTLPPTQPEPTSPKQTSLAIPE
jgi:flagellar protein FlgJ